jgi:membrane protease YdiL (CAAX protease family)
VTGRYLGTATRREEMEMEDSRGDGSVEKPPGWPMIRSWQRIPVLVRAIVEGLLVYAVVGSLARAAILVFIPAPWSLVVMGAVLWVYWRYFSGSGWPRSTARARRRSFRATRLSANVWTWSLIAALLAAVAMESSFVVTFRVFEFRGEAWAMGPDLSTVPPWLAWSMVVMGALVAGITEEIGFRGYMQVPLEERYGPAAAIVIVSIVFVVFHLNQAWASPVLFHLFAISLLWGILARVSGSLVPGIVSHAVADVFNFSYWWTDVVGTFNRRPIAETGFDAHFLIWALVLVASVAAFLGAGRRTLVARQQRRSRHRAGLSQR